MNPWLSCALADARGRELRGEPACPRGRQAPGEAARSLVQERLSFIFCRRSGKWARALTL